MKEKLVSGITVDGKPVVIYQLKLEHVLSMGEKVAADFADEGKPFSISDIKKKFFELVQISSSLSEKEFRQLTFEEIEAVEGIWREVNAPLFRYLDRSKKLPIVSAWLKRMEQISLQESEPKAAVSMPATT